MSTGHDDQVTPTYTCEVCGRVFDDPKRADHDDHWRYHFDPTSAVERDDILTAEELVASLVAQFGANPYVSDKRYVESKALGVLEDAIEWLAARGRLELISDVPEARWLPNKHPWDQPPGTARGEDGR